MTSWVGDFRALVDDVLRARVYQRSGNIWRKQLGRVSVGIDLQSASLQGGKAVTLNFGVNLPGKSAYFDGSDDGGQYRVGDTRIGQLNVPKTDLWWNHSDSGWKTVPLFADSWEFDISRFRSLLQQACRLIEEATPPGFCNLPVSSATLDAILCAWQWSEEGMPVEKVGLKELANSVVVELPTDLSTKRPDLVASVVECATPFEAMKLIRNCEAIGPSSLRLNLLADIDLDELRARYERYLAARRFSTIPVNVQTPLIGSVLFSVDDEDSQVGGPTIDLDDVTAANPAVDDWVRLKQLEMSEQLIWREDSNQIVIMDNRVDLLALKQELKTYIRSHDETD